MILSQKQMIFTVNVASLIDYIHAHEHGCTFGEAYRTPEQAEIYAQQGKGITDSLHCKKLAIDLNIFDANGKYVTEKSEYQKFGDYWKSLHSLNRWGGDFKYLVDSNHFEMQDS